MKGKSVLEFAKSISGIFSNKEQALENPKKFAHIEIHIRPLFFKAFNCYSFYSEQSYKHDKWNPYRQSINKLSKDKDTFIMSNYRIDNPERLTGGGSNMSILEDISKHRIYKKVGCSMHFEQKKPGNYFGNLEVGKKCFIQKEQTLTYIKSEVILYKKHFICEDSGYEEKTDKKIWGSKFGPLIFKKVIDFDQFIESNWK